MSNLVDDLALLGIDPIKVSYTHRAETYIKKRKNYGACNMFKDGVSDEFLLALSKCKIGGESISYIRVFKDHIGYVTTGRKVVIFRHMANLQGSNECPLQKVRVGIGIPGVRFRDSSYELDGREEQLLLGHTGTRRNYGINLHIDLIQNRDFDARFMMCNGPMMISYRDYELKPRHTVTELYRDKLEGMSEIPNKMEESPIH